MQALLVCLILVGVTRKPVYESDSAAIAGAVDNVPGRHGDLPDLERYRQTSQGFAALCMLEFNSAPVDAGFHLMGGETHPELFCLSLFELEGVLEGNEHVDFARASEERRFREDGRARDGDREFCVLEPAHEEEGAFLFVAGEVQVK